MAKNTSIQHLRGDGAPVSSGESLLLQGEIAIDTDKDVAWIQPGVSAGSLKAIGNIYDSDGTIVSDSSSASLYKDCLLLDASTSAQGLPAEYEVANNLTTNAPGFAILDAYQGKILNDAIQAIASYQDRERIVDLIYPIGSIYMSVNNVSPEILFGGSWEQIEDTFLLSAGQTYSAGDTGGSADAIVVSHNHTFTGSSSSISSSGAHTHTVPNHTHTVSSSGTCTISSSGTHNHTARFKGFTGTASTSGWYYARRNISGDGYDTTATITHSADGGHTHTVPNHTHTISSSGTCSITSSGAHTHSVTPNGTISTNGSSGTGANMPPYLTVYMWKRVEPPVSEEPEAESEES